MGVRRCRRSPPRLIEAGRGGRASRSRSSKPARCRGSARSRATLATIAGAAREAGVRRPSVTVVGAVAALAGGAGVAPAAPARGQHRRGDASASAGERARALARASWARASCEAPAIRMRPLPGPPLDPAPYDLICLTSANGVRGAVRAARRIGAAARCARARRRRASPRSARARPTRCASTGSGPTSCPHAPVAEGLVEALDAELAERPARRALIARGARGARRRCPTALRARGVEVDVLDALRDRRRGARRQGRWRRRVTADYITFTSSSTVRFFLEAAGGPRAISPRRAARLDRPRDERRAARGRSRAARRGRAPRRRRGWSTRCWPTLLISSQRSVTCPGHHLPLRLRPRQRVRRRLPRGDRASLPRRARDRPDPRDPPPRRPHGRDRAARDAPLPARRDHPGRRRPRRRHDAARAGGARSPCAPSSRTGCWSARTTAC